MQEEKLNKLYNKYKIKDNLIIGRVVRKTIRYIEKNIDNFPNNFIVLKNRIIECCYNILEYTYRANIFQDINDKKEIVVKIGMLNFYLEEALNKKLISKKRFESYINHIMEIDKMVRSWLTYEKKE